jgi:hypothetical protein
MAKGFAAELREKTIVSQMTASVLYVQPAVQEVYPELRSRQQRSPIELSQSRWGFAILSLKQLANVSDRPIKEKVGQLFWEASQRAYSEVQLINPGARLVLPEFLHITNRELAERVAVFYVEEATSDALSDA